MNMVDDATSTVEARLRDEETIWAATRVLRQWIEKDCVPLALYTDWKNVYVREPTEKELLHGKVPVTQFGRMCQKLTSGLLPRIHCRPKDAWSGAMGRIMTV